MRSTRGVPQASPLGSRHSVEIPKRIDRYEPFESDFERRASDPGRAERGHGSGLHGPSTGVERVGATFRTG